MDSTDTSDLYDSNWLFVSIDGQLEQVEKIPHDEGLKRVFRSKLTDLRSRLKPGMCFNIGRDFVLIARKR